MRYIVAFLIDVDDETTDEISDFIEETCSPFGPGTIIDHEVRVDVGEETDHLDRYVSFTTDEGQRELDPFFDTAFEPRSWEKRGAAEFGSLMDTHGIAYNRESYFRQ